MDKRICRRYSREFLASANSHPTAGKAARESKDLKGSPEDQDRLKYNRMDLHSRESVNVVTSLIDSAI